MKKMKMNLGGSRRDDVDDVGRERWMGNYYPQKEGNTLP